MSYVLHSQSVPFHQSDFVGSFIVVTVVSFFNDSMCLWSTIFMPYGFCRPYGKRKCFFVSITILNVFILMGSLLIWLTGLLLVY